MADTCKGTGMLLLLAHVEALYFIGPIWGKQGIIGRAKKKYIAAFRIAMGFGQRFEETGRATDTHTCSYSCSCWYQIGILIVNPKLQLRITA